MLAVVAAPTGILASVHCFLVTQPFMGSETRSVLDVNTLTRSRSRSWRKRKSLQEELEPDTPLEAGGHNRVSLGQEDEVQELNGSAGELQLHRLPPVMV